MAKKSLAKKMSDDTVNEPLNVNMTPMIDCVFQLLIFFMLGCRFRTSEGRIEAFLPKNRGMGTAGTPAITLQEVRIKLLWIEKNGTRESRDPANGRVMLKVKDINFKWVPNKYDEELPDYEALVRLIEQARDNFKPTKTYKALPVIIDARAQVPFKHIVHSLNACLKAKVTDVTFAAPEIPY